jgi:hypothetical protein
MKLQAAYFLIGNMDQQAYITYAVADSTGGLIEFDVLDYPTYEALAGSWDSLQAEKGTLYQKNTGTMYDYEKITAEYLIENIDLAFEAWDRPWARHLSFEQFCEYILPYRSTNEPLETWRRELAENYAWVVDSMGKNNDPLKACALINNEIRSWFRFDPRFYEHATDQGLNEMMDVKMGRCEDMTNLAIYAMRAMGVPVMSDFTPYWAKTGNNHAWNAILDAQGKVVIFMGGESNPGEYRLNQDKAKVYRKTFARQENSLASLLNENERAPKYIDRDNIVDVTDEYIPVSDVELEVVNVEGERFIYLCVFNAGDWKAIHWAIPEAGTATFTKMGMDIAYLPGRYVDGGIQPAGPPFILNTEGNPVYLIADTTSMDTLTLGSTTRRVTKNTTDNIEKVFFTTGERYELFYWDQGWVSAGIRMAGEGRLEFPNVPTGALYWLVNTKPDKDRPERIFVVTEDGRQLFY